jgi:hypothetical protein
MNKHTYAVFYQVLTGKKTEYKSAELDFIPTKIISLSEVSKALEVLKNQHPKASEINITGLTYLRSHEE